MDFITYFTVIQTKPICDKVITKKRRLVFPKFLFCTSKQLFALDFLLAVTCGVLRKQGCPITFNSFTVFVSQSAKSTVVLIRPQSFRYVALSGGGWDDIEKVIKGCLQLNTRYSHRIVT